MAIKLTLLQIIQAACQEMGLLAPVSVVNSADLQTQQLLGLANREIRELQQNYEWTQLQTEYDLHVAPPILTTGNVQQDSYEITGIPTTNGISGATFVVSGQFLPVDTRVFSINDGTSLFLSQPATGNATNTSLTFAQDTYPEPLDFDRFINDTWWDRTNRWKLLGPDSPQIDQWHRSGVVTVGPRRHFRQIGALGAQGGPAYSSGFSPAFGGATPGFLSNYRLWPPPGATDTPIDLVFEYITQNSVWSATGTAQPTFLADTDFPVLDPNLVIMGIKWRFFQIKGWDYAAFQTEYNDYVTRAYSNNGGNKTLNMSKSRQGYLISPQQVPDGSWPSGAG